MKQEGKRSASNRHPNSSAAAVLKLHEQRSEHRRQKRQYQKREAKVCFNCRQPGHDLNSCTAVQTSNMPMGVCFKCGSTEHKVSGCRLKTSEFPYAKCFVCGQTGHLSRSCKANPNGAFPDGGSCLLCGSNQHLRSECPRLEEETAESELTLSKASTNQSVDFQDVAIAAPKKTKKAKIVKF